MKALLVATPGGHLDQLFELAPRFLQPGAEVKWVTARTAQSESLLQDEDVEWAPKVNSRQFGAAARVLPRAVALVHRFQPDALISTGAALAFPYLLAARSRGVTTHYIDSATRGHAPSLTGRAAQRLPGVHLYHQAATWPSSRWSRIPSVFDDYEAVPCEDPRNRRVVISLGSEKFPFPRAMRSCAAALDSDSDAIWQLGHTQPDPGLPGSVHQWLPFTELAESVAKADTVVCHAGVGSILMAMRAGRCPVVIPRYAGQHEHIDEHQIDLAERLEGRHLALVARPGQSIAPLIHAASQCRVQRRTNSSTFE